MLEHPIQVFLPRVSIVSSFHWSSTLENDFNLPLNHLPWKSDDPEMQYTYIHRV